MHIELNFFAARLRQCLCRCQWVHRKGPEGTKAPKAGGAEGAEGPEGAQKAPPGERTF